MESTQVVSEWVLDRSSSVSHVKEEMLDASCKVGEGPAGMRQNDLQIRILVERAGIDEFARQEGVFNGGVDPRGEVGRPRRPASAESVGHTIHLMKDDRIVQLLNARKNRRKAWIKYVIAF